MCSMVVSICALFMVLGFVLMRVVLSMLLYVVCFLRLCVAYCDVVCGMFCLICDACSWRCPIMRSWCISSCRWYVLVSAVLPVSILSDVFVLYVVC